MLHVIYDDQCGFCIRSLKLCRALDRGRRLRFHGASTFRLKPDATAEDDSAGGPEHVDGGGVRVTPDGTGTPQQGDDSGFRLRPEGTVAFPQLAGADFENAMFAVAPDGSVTRGFFAFRRIAREVPLMWPLLVLLYLPGSGPIGPRVYAWVARNRGRFGCESEVCDLPDAGRPRL